MTSRLEAAVQDLLISCEKAIETYDWIHFDWGRTVDPDNVLPGEVAELRRAVGNVRQVLDRVPDIFEEPMTNDWSVSEEDGGSNPDIYVESASYGTICQITGGKLAHRRERAQLIARAPALDEALAKVITWLEANHPDVLEQIQASNRSGS